MDHKWGRNVSEQGMGSWGITLAARYPPFPGWFLTDKAPPFGNLATMIKPPVDPQGTYDVALVGKFLGHPHFPYGYAVEPDGPV